MEYLLLCVALVAGIAPVSLGLSSMQFPIAAFRRSKLVIGSLCRLEFCFQVITEIFDRLSSIDCVVYFFEKKPPKSVHLGKGGGPVIPCEQTNGRTEMITPITALRNFCEHPPPPPPNKKATNICFSLKFENKC